MSDEQRERIKDMFLKAKTGEPPKNNSQMTNAILWLTRSESAWADTLEQYVSHQDSIQLLLQMERLMTPFNVF